MKKKDKITGNTYRINDHKLLAIRLVERADGSFQYEIEQMITEDTLPKIDEDKAHIRVNATNMRMGLSETEVHAVVNDLMGLYIDKHKSKVE